MGLSGKTHAKRATDQLLYRVIHSETIIVKLDGEGPYVLNPVGTTVWGLLDGTRTLGEIASTVCAEYDVTRETALQDIVEWVEWLVARELVIVEPAPSETGDTNAVLIAADHQNLGESWNDRERSDSISRQP
jgi:hypothetical protein